jgi:hypothetical protein
VDPTTKPFRRAAIIPVLVAIAFAAAGCSVSFGTTPDAPATAAATATADSAGPSAAVTSSDAAALCTDLSTEDQVDLSDIQDSLTYWQQVVADAPPDIADQAQAVDDGFNKIADGTSPDDLDNNNAINDAINALEAWDVDNCPG